LRALPEQKRLLRRPAREAWRAVEEIIISRPREAPITVTNEGRVIGLVFEQPPGRREWWQCVSPDGAELFRLSPYEAVPGRAFVLRDVDGTPLAEYIPVEAFAGIYRDWVVRDGTGAPMARMSYLSGWFGGTVGVHDIERNFIAYGWKAWERHGPEWHLELEAEQTRLDKRALFAIGVMSFMLDEGGL